MLSKMKKCLCIGLCFLMLITVFPLSAFATENEESDGIFNYRFCDYSGTARDGYCVTLCLKNESEIIIPDSFNGFPVKYIEGDMFANCSNLKKVTIPETIEDIPGDFLLDFIYSNSKYGWVENFTIEGKPGTCAEEFAHDHGPRFLSTDCDHTQKELLDKTDATCTDDGYTGDVWCTVCYAIYDAGETIPAIGGEHKISGWIIDKKATVDNIGYKHRVCTRCGMDMGEGYIPHVKPKKIKLASVSNSSSGVKITWNKDSNSSGYRVYRKTYSDGKWSGWKKIDEVKKTEYVDYDVTSGRKYKYTVRGCNINGNGSYDKTGLEIYYVSKTTLKSVSKAEKGYNISWKKRSGATGYRVYRSVYSNGEWSEWTKIKTTKATSFNDTNANSEKLYKYRVRAYKGSSYSSASNVLSTKSSALEPKITSIKNIENGVKVSWRKVKGAESYSIYCKDNYNSWSKVATVSSKKSSYSYKNKELWGTCYYCVKANYKGVPSTYTVKKFEVIPTPEVTLKTTGSGINISWSFITAFLDKYYIYRKAPGEKSWEKIGQTVGYENRSFTDKNVKNNKKYTYTVRGVKGSTLGSYNKKGVSKKYMSSPKVTYKVGKNVVLNWSKVSGATKYRVYRRHDRTFKWELLKTTTGTSFTDKNINYGVYAVKAVNDNNSSGLSDIYINTERYEVQGYYFYYPTSESRREKMARKVAKEIAAKCTKGNDRERVANAAEMVYDYYATCCYDSDYGSDVYNEAYGVFWGQLCTCAGTAAAMGMVLEEMGFDYTHVNKGKYDHQWCVLTMDGKKGWADGMAASANYGTLDTNQPDIYLTNVQKERYMKFAKDYVVECAKELGLKIDQSVSRYYETGVNVECGEANLFGSPEDNIEYRIFSMLDFAKSEGADKVSYKFVYSKHDDGNMYMDMEFGFNFPPVKLSAAEKKLCKNRLNYADEYIKCYGFQKNLIFEEVAPSSNRKSTSFSMLGGKSEKKYRAEVREFVNESFAENKDAVAYSYSVKQSDEYISMKIDFWDEEGYQDLLKEKEFWGI